MVRTEGADGTYGTDRTYDCIEPGGTSPGVMGKSAADF
jgi:hypothetical protein